MAESVGGAASGHAVQLLAKTLNRVAVVVNGIGAGQQFARLGEKYDDAAHYQTRSSNVDIAR